MVWGILPRTFSEVICSRDALFEESVMQNTRKYRVLVVEDDRWSSELMVEWVSMRNELELAGRAATGAEALDMIRAAQSPDEPGVDLVLLDINLPGMSGLELLGKLDVLPYVIFTTAHEEYAVDAFEIGAVDYLLKPIELERFHKAINRFLSIMENNIPFDMYRVVEEMRGGDKYRKSPLDDDLALEYAERIVRHMEEHRAFADEDITLQKLAGDLSIPPHHVSQVLNSTLKKNYYTFINTYRVEEAKKLLARKEAGSMTILEIAGIAGFKSKSVFNAVFKEFTGLTPKEFREHGDNE